MAAVVDVANIASANNNANSPAGNCTCAASDNFLLIIAGSDQTVAASAPSVLTYNGVSLLGNLIVSNTFTSNGRFTLGAYYLVSPPTGSALAVVCTTPNPNTAIAWVALPMSGVNISSPIGNTNSAVGSTGSPTVTVTGGGANDLYLGSLITRASAITPPGGNQTNLKNIGPLNSPSNTLDAISVDSILGSNSGAFSWTNTATDTVRIGFAIQGLASGTAATSTPPSTTIAASTVAASNSAPFWGMQWNQFVQMQISNQSNGWAFINFGVAGSVTAATVATGYPVAPGSVVLVSVAAEVTGASVILSNGAGNVVFTRVTHEPFVTSNH